MGLPQLSLLCIILQREERESGEERNERICKRRKSRKGKSSSDQTGAGTAGKAYHGTDRQGIYGELYIILQLTPSQKRKKESVYTIVKSVNP